MPHIKDGFSGERSIVLPQMAITMQKNDPLVSSLYITDIGYYPCARYHSRERREPIRQNVLIYCVEGRGYYTVGGSEHKVSANQYFILPAGTPHAYWSDDDNPWTIYWIHFSGGHAAYYTEGAAVPQDVRPGITSRISDRNSIFEEIFFTISNGYNRENMRYASSLLHYYLGSMRFLQQFRNANAKRERLSDDTLVSEAVRYMGENIECRLSLDALAAYMGYSASYFAATFKRLTGSSPLSYFNRMKVERACELMETTEMKVNQICHKVGIDDSYYFSRLFKKIKGMSPRMYREAAGDGADDRVKRNG